MALQDLIGEAIVMTDGMDYSDHGSTDYTDASGFSGQTETIDSDGDGYADTVLVDTNDDGVTDAQYTEYADGSTVTLLDSDGDSQADAQVVELADGTVVTDVDVNGDGYADGTEVDYTDGSAYAEADTDGDGVVDRAGVFYADGSSAVADAGTGTVTWTDTSGETSTYYEDGTPAHEDGPGPGESSGGGTPYVTPESPDDSGTSIPGGSTFAADWNADDSWSTEAERGV